MRNSHAAHISRMSLISRTYAAHVPNVPVQSGGGVMFTKSVSSTSPRPPAGWARAGSSHDCPRPSPASAPGCVAPKTAGGRHGQTACSKGSWRLTSQKSGVPSTANRPPRIHGAMPGARGSRMSYGAGPRIQPRMAEYFPRTPDNGQILSSGSIILSSAADRLSLGPEATPPRTVKDSLTVDLFAHHDTIKATKMRNAELRPRLKLGFFRGRFVFRPFLGHDPSQSAKKEIRSNAYFYGTWRRDSQNLYGLFRNVYCNF